MLSTTCVCVFRCVYSAAVWYHDHLAGMMDVVMITEDQNTVAQYGSLNAGVYVITVQVRTLTAQSRLFSLTNTQVEVPRFHAWHKQAPRHQIGPRRHALNANKHDHRWDTKTRRLLNKGWHLQGPNQWEVVSQSLDKTHKTDRFLRGIWRVSPQVPKTQPTVFLQSDMFIVNKMLIVNRVMSSQTDTFYKGKNRKKNHLNVLHLMQDFWKEWWRLRIRCWFTGKFMSLLTTSQGF